MRNIVFALVLAGCGPGGPDVCADFPGVPCIALEVRAEDRLVVDQIRVSALSGFRTVPDNDGASPDAPTELELPVVMAVVPPSSFAGPYTLVARAFNQGRVLGQGQTSGTIGSEAHVQATITLGTPPNPTPPSITKLEPPAACVDTAFDLTITGSNIREINDVPAKVRIDDQTLSSTGCGAGQACSVITASVAPISATGTHHVVVINPAPDSTESDSADLQLLAKPRISSTTTNAGKCDAGVTLSGTHFYRFDGHEPTVKVDNKTVSLVATTDCIPSIIAGVVVEDCAQLDFSATIGTGSHSVKVVGPPPLDCESTAVTLPCF